MRRMRGGKRITGNAYRVLAALLLADGGWLTRGELAAGLFDRPVAGVQVYRHLNALRRLGAVRIETRCGVGTRLVAIPADEHLRPVLALVPAVKRSRWWAVRHGYPSAAWRRWRRRFDERGVDGQRA